jgi:ankyrin repeat protein
MTVCADMKNPYIIPAAMICAAILVGFWMLKPPSEPQKAQKSLNNFLIYVAASEGNTEAVKQHLAAGADVNAKDNLGTLRYAASGGHKEIVELLIANGADVYAKGGGNGTTPLDMAIRLRRTELADLLRKHGGKTSGELKAEGK